MKISPDCFMSARIIYEEIIYNYLGMGIVITAKLLDQIGLLLGFISGLLLIPEVINFLPLAKLQNSIQNQLDGFTTWAKRYPQRFYPPSWKHNFTEEQRESIEPKTAIRTFVFSLVWISILIWGISSSSTILVILVLSILLIVTLGNMVVHLTLWRFLNPVKLIMIFITMFFMLVVFTPLISLARIVLLIARTMILPVHKFFLLNDILRTLLTSLAILLFIISNILQFVATLI